jgi:hypothetical protein
MCPSLFFLLVDSIVVTIVVTVAVSIVDTYDVDLVPSGSPVVLVPAEAGFNYTHVAVDWVNNEVFYVRSTQNRVSFLFIFLGFPGLGSPG